MNDAWSQSDNPAAALVAFFGMMSEEQRQSLSDAVRIVQGPETQEPTEPSESAEPAERPERGEGPEENPASAQDPGGR
jgi:hypothetical protein